MNDLEIIYNYKSNDELRQSFNKLSFETFNIDFEKWYQKRFWNDRYICYSYTNGSKIVSNLSVNLIEIISNNDRYDALQIGTVMTDPLYRNKGLAKNLMDRVISEYEKKVDIIYLFPNDSVIDFYMKFGFRKIVDKKYSLCTKSASRSSSIFQKLDLDNEDDLNLLRSYLSVQKEKSYIFDVRNSGHIQSWYFVNELRDHIHYFKNRNVIVIFEEKNDQIHLYDYLSADNSKTEDIVGIFGDIAQKKINLYFTPDRAFFESNIVKTEENGVMLFKSDILKLDYEFSHPMTSRG